MLVTQTRGCINDPHWPCFSCKVWNISLFLHNIEDIRCRHIGVTRWPVSVSWYHGHQTQSRLALKIFKIWYVKLHFLDWCMHTLTWILHNFFIIFIVVILSLTDASLGVKVLKTILFHHITVRVESVWCCLILSEICSNFITHQIAG